MKKIKQKKLIFNLKDAKKILPTRDHHSNKTDGGKTLVIAGSKGMMGAGVLTASAAARVGSGYTYLCTDLHAFSSVDHPDFLTLDINKKIRNIEKFDSVALGPGLGSSKKCIIKTQKWIKKFLESKTLSVVLDADGLTALSQMNLRQLPHTWILTPHIGELSRLLQVPSMLIQRSPNYYAVEAQKRWGCVVVLKGSPTFVCDEKNSFQIFTGTPALAKAGTGDVLTGMIAGFLAQGLAPLAASCLGVCLHGQASQVWLNEKNDHLSLLASDLVAFIPKTMHQLRKSHA